MLEAANAFFKSLVAAREVAVVITTFLLISVAFGVLLLGGVCFNPADKTQNVNDYRSALVMLFQFMFTGGGLLTFSWPFCLVISGCLDLFCIFQWN
jgi:hypothetical protein